MSLIKEPAGLKLCRQPLPAGKATCLRVTRSDARGSKATLRQSGRFSLIRDGGARLLMIDKTVVTPVTLPAGTVSWRLDGNGDPTRPLILTTDSAGDPHHLRVAADGAVSEWYAVPRVPVTLSKVFLTPNRLIGSYLSTRGTSQWIRNVGNSLGTAREFPDAGVVTTASAGRWVLDDTKGRAWHYYNGQRIGRTVAQIVGLSGPYAQTVNGAVKLITCTSLAKKGVDAIFGSLIAERVSSTGYTVKIRDLADPTSKPVTVTLDDTQRRYSLTYLWGDWVGTSFLSFETERTTSVLVNYRTGERYDHDGQLVGLGDGLAVLSDSTGHWSTWVPDTGETEALGNATDFPALGLAGNRVAYSTGTTLVVRTVDGVGTSAPRLLGAVTSGKATRSSPWKASFDLSKPVASGTLIIRDSKGRTVRKLVTAASSSGSLPVISWTGKDADGHALPAGRYSWELVAAASDGSGVARSVAGTAAATGSLVHG